MFLARLASALAGCGPLPSATGQVSEVADPPSLGYSNKWRIEVSEGARSTGPTVPKVMLVEV